MAQIEISRQEMAEMVKGLKVLRDRAYSAYSNHKDRSGETAQSNLKRYEELDALRVRIEADYWSRAEKPLDFMRR
jgi:hypothetical protein